MVVETGAKTQQHLLKNLTYQINNVLLNGFGHNPRRFCLSQCERQCVLFSFVFFFSYVQKRDNVLNVWKIVFHQHVHSKASWYFGAYTYCRVSQCVAGDELAMTMHDNTVALKEICVFCQTWDDVFHHTIQTHVFIWKLPKYVVPSTFQHQTFSILTFEFFLY